MTDETPNSDKIVLHDENGKFIKGHPKIGGREKGSRSFTTKVKEALEKLAEGKENTYEETLVKVVLKKAIVDQDQQMIKLIWNYLDGMPNQNLNLGNQDELPFTIKIEKNGKDDKAI